MHDGINTGIVAPEPGAEQASGETNA